MLTALIKNSQIEELMKSSQFIDIDQEDSHRNRAHSVISLTSNQSTKLKTVQSAINSQLSNNIYGSFAVSQQYNTLPPTFINNPSQIQYQPLSLSGQLKTTIQRSIERQQKQSKPTRQVRMNIPKAILINKKTGQQVPNTTYINEENQQHIEDRQIVQRINRMLIQGQWRYSSLLGKQNRRTVEKERTTKALKDGQFPQVLALVSMQMKANFQRDGQKFVHLVQCPHKVKMVHDTMTFGLTPTLSRYFVFGLFGLTKNLQPSLFALGFATDLIVELRKDQLYYQILKTFVQGVNQELADQRRQVAIRKKLLGRKIREPELVTDDNFIFPQILFCKTDKAMESACQRIRQEFSISFEMFPSFLQRFTTVNIKFLRHEIKKQKDIVRRGEVVIKTMLESNNRKDIEQGVKELNQHNEAFASRFKNLNLEKNCLLGFEKRYYGFNVYEKFQKEMVDYLAHLVVEKRGQTLKYFLDNILRLQQKEQKKVKKPYQDTNGQLVGNERLRKLRTIIEPNVLTEFVKRFQLSRSLKYEKVDEGKYNVGSGKCITKTIVQFKHEMWKCECGYQAKIGIPCIHLLKILHMLKTPKYEDYIHPCYYKLSGGPIFVQLAD